MNIKELSEIVKENQKKKLEEAIEDIESSIEIRANKGFNKLRVTTDSELDLYKIVIDHYMIEPLKEYFENNGYKVEIEEIKGFTKWIEKILYKVICGAYLPDYFMIIRWEYV